MPKASHAPADASKGWKRRLEGDPIELRAPRPGLYRCHWCGKTFEARQPAVTCSPSHQVQRSRARSEAAGKS